jgi:hypothetical protein
MTKTNAGRDGEGAKTTTMTTGRDEGAGAVASNGEIAAAAQTR